MSIERLRARDDPTNDGFVITDEGGRMLMHVPFLEVLGPRRKVNVQVNRRTTNRAIEACQRQMLRSHTLRSELRTEFEKTRSNLVSSEPGAGQNALRASRSALMVGLCRSNSRGVFLCHYSTGIHHPAHRRMLAVLDLPFDPELLGGRFPGT
jgi:hypothetical protein